MRIVHLMASPFYGGPERQMLGLAPYLPGDVQSIYLSFPEGGRARPFIDEVRKQGYEGSLLTNNFPRVFACIREVADELRRLKADVLCCSGYKPDVIGWRAARRIGIPVVAVAHGWTWATWKVRCYESLDRWVMRSMDAVVCVSKAQADKVRRAKVAEAKIVTIQNAVGTEAFVEADAEVRAEMLGWFMQSISPQATKEPARVDPASSFVACGLARTPRFLVGAAGRFSPEKGFAVFVEAAAQVAKTRGDVGFLLFGDGPLRADIERLIAERGLTGRFVLAGFRGDLHRYLPNLDVAVMSSYTEGLPVILLETGRAGVPTVATAVGGIPEVIDDGVSGCLVPAGDATMLAQRISDLLANDEKRRAMGAAARERVRSDFSFVRVGKQYHELFTRLIADRR